MTGETNRPSKERVREWLLQRRDRPAPPPDIEQIQRILGWKSPETKRKLYAI